VKYLLCAMILLMTGDAMAQQDNSKFLMNSGHSLAFPDQSNHYLYAPQPDITTYELALILPALFAVVAGGGNAVGLVEKLPPEAKRHFKKQ
jgi:hypothetical protein